MRDTIIGVGLVFGALGLGGAAILGVALVTCTVSLTPIPFAAVTAMMRLMVIGILGLLASMLAMRHRFSS